MIQKFPKINFIGNKEKIAKWITDYFPEDAESVFDAFSGGGSVSYFSKAKGLKVISNDILKINYFISKALVENSEVKLDFEDIDLIFSGTPKEGFMFNNYSEIFFFPKECKELDLYRENIDKLSSEYKKALALILMRRAMIRKMPYSRFNINWEKIVELRNEKLSYEKYKRKRAYHNQSFKTHFLENINDYNRAVFDNEKNNLSLNEDVFDAIEKFQADIIYLDPPYTGTMNNYFGFYGMLDEYIEGKKIEPFGNNFIDKKTSIDLFDKLFSKLGNFKYWYLSYNNSSYPTKEILIELLRKYSDNIKIIERPHIYKITGKENKKSNIEYLFIVENKN
ncbi:MAG: DNA adenine methylase [Chryseobacterium sp.]|nr:DNA adenine methylase [Chryseobacterium sp.]